MSAKPEQDESHLADLTVSEQVRRIIPLVLMAYDAAARDGHEVKKRQLHFSWSLFDEHDTNPTK